MGPFIRSFQMAQYTFDRYHSAGDLQQFPNVCLGFVLQGQAEFLYKGRVYTAKPGDLIYIAKGTTYYSIWHGNPHIVFYSLSFEFTDPYAMQEYAFQTVSAPALRQRFDTLYHNSREDVSFGVVGELYRLLEELYPMLVSSERKLAEKTVLPAIAYLEQHYTEKISVAQLAALCGFSESRFFTVFKQVTNCTPVEYKQNVSVQHALELLSETALSVEEISRFLGFSSPAYFRRVFRAVTGQTPKSLRQKATAR
ncbi:MAG: AraC family transcriptional regulator [Clostridia bacterium]|nr:AraC family transcriptional regulator [Clostridia bacterium]